MKRKNKRSAGKETEEDREDPATSGNALVAAYYCRCRGS